jgi:hypothetical protein
VGLKVLLYIMVRFAPDAGLKVIKASPLQLEHEP